MVNFLGKYAKAFTALLGTGGAALLAALADGKISGTDWLAIALAILTPASVAAVRNSNTIDQIKSSVHDVVE